jgi:hypothetical protein
MKRVRIHFDSRKGLGANKENFVVLRQVLFEQET